MENLKKTSAILILITIVLAMSAANTVHALGVTDTITVGNLPYGVAYDSIKSEIFVSNAGGIVGESTISVISDNNNTAVATIPTGEMPSAAGAIAYDSGKNEIFVTHLIVQATNTPSSVSVISDSTNTVAANIKVGNDPDGIAYDSGKSEIFVANLASNQAASGVLSVITDSNNTVVATVPVGDAPEGVTYDSSKSAIFVTNFFDNRTAGGYFSDTVKVVSDSYPLAAPLVTSSHSTLVKGQTSKLTSAVTTGASPYTYQWFSEAPGASSYSSIGGATSSSYSFTASTSTATGNWSFTLQVTDSTGAAVNSTATTVIVNSNPTVPEFSTETIILVLSVMVVVSFCALVMVGKKKSTRTISDSKYTKKSLECACCDTLCFTADVVCNGAFLPVFNAVRC